MRPLSSYEIAEHRAAALHPAQRDVFLEWFARGRADELTGEDYGWRRVLRERGPAAVAGYLEGAASVRPRHVPRRIPRQRDRRGRGHDPLGRYAAGAGVAA